MSTIVKVPVHPHVHKFLLHRFSSKDVICIDVDSFLGSIFQIALERIEYKLKPRTQPANTVELKFKLPNSLSHLNLSDDAAINLGRFMYQYYKEDIASFVDGRISITKNRSEAISYYLQVNRIEDEIEHDSCEKFVSRRLRVRNSFLRNFSRDNPQKASNVPKI
jgi:hypothetical protein